MPMPTTATRAAAADVRDTCLRVRFSDGAHADFHYFWLRHHCDCCRHPQTGERTLCSSQVYDNVRMLHDHRGFAGARWVRGVYFNEGD